MGTVITGRMGKMERMEERKRDGEQGNGEGRVGGASVDFSSASGIMSCQLGLTTRRGQVLSAPSATAKSMFLLPPTLLSNGWLSAGRPQCQEGQGLMV